MIEIELLHVPDCPNRPLARARLEQALAMTEVAASVREIRVTTLEEAARLGMAGSPTLRVAGEDPFAVGGTPASLSCRIYRHGDAVDGAPSLGQLVRALRARHG